MAYSPAIPIYTVEQTRLIETQASEQPLMQRAGASAAQLAKKLTKDIQGSILILAGPGNNGGDAFEAATLLQKDFFDIVLVFTGSEEKFPPDAKKAYQRFIKVGGCCSLEIPTNHRWALIIDGLFGIGLTRELSSDYQKLINEANTLSREHACPLLALDCPSGLNAQTGTAQKTTIQATHTITFIGMKPGLLTAEGAEYCGKIEVANLDLALEEIEPAAGLSISPACFSDYLKPRALNSHKGSFGNAGLLGGSASMTGALHLAARSALYLGAGRVYAGLLDEKAAKMDFMQPELMFKSPPELLSTELTALACGPGMAHSGENKRLLCQACELKIPLVLDAGAINLLASEEDLCVMLATREAPTILTPHPAEAARLLETSTLDIQNNRVEAALQIAKHYNAFVALKGCGTIVALPEQFWFINTTGNPGLASAGTGDVLTGMIASLLAQGWPPTEALLAGVHLHGLAADKLVSEGIGPIGLTASELLPVARRCLNEWVQQNSLHQA